ncbi:breast cancer anti-estrogen resistance protein 1-like isoform X1 [Ornithodoros turicata]|uniref:breast cancer anti-estrogen resistance protein 1-like isoform X1 n=1 Tax=Ornithodoros turicata TaxID=34597 RepID=UPI003139A66E
MRKNCLARALYDNIAESPEELAFRKNDVLTVLEQNPDDLEGWWLCALRGRQGLAPGNRLRLIPRMYDPTGLGYATGTIPDNVNMGTISPHQQHNVAMNISGTYPGPGKRHSTRRSWRVDANKVVTPNKVGDVYLYDVPVGAKVAEEYDFPAHSALPTPVTRLHADTVVPTIQSLHKLTLQPSSVPYDEPRQANVSCDASRSTLTAEREALLSDVPGVTVYDIPRGNMDYDIPNPDLPVTYDTPPPPREMSKVACTTYDIPQESGLQSAMGVVTYDVPVSGRSSGVSLMSTSSSSGGVSPASSQSSLNTSLSLSSLCGSNRSSLEQAHDMYDIPACGPKRPVEGLTTRASLGAVPPPPCHDMAPLQFYDIPTNNAPALPLHYDIPPKRGARPPATVSLDGVYDVPPQVTRDIQVPPSTADETDSSKRHSSSSTESQDYEAVGELKEIHLERDAALEVLVKLHQEVTSAITKLFSLTHSTWKRQENATEARLHDLKLNCYRLRSSLQEFLAFAQGALTNAACAEDRKLYQKLARLTKPLADSYRVVLATTQSLDEKGWQVGNYTGSSPDALDHLVACARGLTEDIQQVASTIQGNSTLIFKRSPLISESGKRPLPAPPKREEDRREWANDYDYVNLESKEAVERENEEIKAALPAELSRSFDKLLKESQVTVEEKIEELPSAGLDHGDVQILTFYRAQIDTHILFLTNAIDAFLATIENNQPPKVFVGHSKFVVICAHKLVYMGDTVYRNVLNQEIKSQVLQCSTNLCEALKVLINSTKKAALQFPSVAAVQQMVDSIVDVSHFANDLKVVVTQVVKR